MSQILLPATSQPSGATAIFLHGLGQTNSSWTPWVQQLAQQLPSVTWILPQADSGPVTFFGGSDRPRWFDVHALPPGEDEDDTPGAAASKEYIQGILQDVIDAGVPSQKIFLVGFSQGSAVALLAGLTSIHTVGGIAVLSGWLPPKLRKMVVGTPPTACPPLFCAHGTADTEIPFQNALENMQWLRSSFAIERTGLVLHEYPGLDHHVNEEVLRDLRAWLANLLSV